MHACVLWMQYQVRSEMKKEGIVKSTGDGFHVQKIKTKEHSLLHYNQPIKYI